MTRKKTTKSIYSGTDIETLVNITRFAGTNNRAWYGQEPSAFDSLIKGADRHRNNSYAFQHSILDMNHKNLKKYIGDINLVPTFGHMFKLLMHDAHVTVEELSELTGISTKAIQRIRNNEVDRPKLNYIIAIALALNLPYEDSILLVNTAGYSLRKHVEIEVIYDIILKHSDDLKTSYCLGKIHNCNSLLKGLGYPPLTKFK